MSGAAEAGRAVAELCRCGGLSSDVFIPYGKYLVELASQCGAASKSGILVLVSMSLASAVYTGCTTDHCW